MPFTRVALLLLLISFANAAPPVIPTAVTSSAQKRVDYGYTPGIVIAMVNPDGRTYYSYGNQSHTDSTPVDENTLYEIGSVTKSFTGVLLAQMEEAGDVAFTDLLSTHLPTGTVLPANGGNTITLEYLAAHRSSIPNVISNLLPTITDINNPFADYNTTHLYDFLANHTLATTPTSTWEYSNFGVGLLGHTLAVSQNKSYEALLKERVLTPLGLTDTTLTLTPDQQARFAPPHVGYATRPQFRMNSLAAAGELVSTAENLLTYLEHNMDLIPGSPLTTAMAESHNSRGPTTSPILGIGLTWFLYDLSGTNIIQHGGDTIGSTAFIGFRPDTQTAAVVLTNNRGHQFAAASDLGFNCLTSSPLIPITNVTPPATLAPTARQAYVGHYSDGTDSFDALLLNGELATNSIGHPTSIGSVYADGSHQFKFYDPSVVVTYTFNFGPSGQVASVTTSGNGITNTYDRIRRDPSLHFTPSGTDLLLNLTGEADTTYQIQSSPDGQTWTTLTPLTTWDPPLTISPDQPRLLFRSLAP